MGIDVAVTQLGLSYKIAPLEGKSAKILTALMARAAPAHIEYQPLQVLIWNIHAGLTYDKMSGDSRKLVDRFIPEYRRELSEDLFASGSVSKVLKRCPFCPKTPTVPKELDKVVQHYRDIQDYLQRYANDFNKLQERFVKVLPGYAPASPTAWSRVSPRVYMRMTGGRIKGEIANVEIRVLSSNTARSSALPGETQLVNTSFGEASTAGPAAQGSDLADVPFAMIGFPNTETGQGLGVVPETPPKQCTISSSAELFPPSDQSRTRIGVGEPVDLTASGDGSFSWSVSSGRREVIQKSANTAIFTAPDRREVDTVTATNGKTSCSISFTVVQPDGLVFRRQDSTVIHTHNRANSGFLADVYLTPSDVSFEEVEIRERDARAVATGVYNALNGDSHYPGGPKSVGPVIEGLDSKLSFSDQVYSGPGQSAPRFVPGHIYWKIPVEFCVLSDGCDPQKGAWTPFTTVTQMHTLESDGVTLTSEKGEGAGRADLRIKVSDPNGITPIP